MRRVRIYVDTSVLGAVFDEEFQTPTAAFFEQSRNGKFDLVVSALVEDEIAEAPRIVRDFYQDMVKYVETLNPSRDAIVLQQAYLDSGVTTAKWADDALHVATATVSGCDIIVSWNFKHMVHFEKKRKYNAVNAFHGYAGIDILTPAEVIEYEEDL